MPTATGSDIPPETMTIEQFVDDTIAVTDYLRQRFHQDRIYILGHSWGSFIALQAAARSPERYKAYSPGSATALTASTARTSPNDLVRSWSSTADGTATLPTPRPAPGRSLRYGDAA